MFLSRHATCLAALLAAPLLSQAATVGAGVDPVNDFLATYTGVRSGDMDVLAASVVYEVAKDRFVLTTKVNGAINTTGNGVYVWGVNKGAGVATFASIGQTNVLFDSVVQLRANGTSNLAGVLVTIAGDTITGVVPGSLLTSTGFAKTAYTWNVWPRDGVTAGTAAIPDFAPNNSTFAAAVAVSEPGGLALAAMGLGAAVLGRRRRSAA